jgi:arylsulfatase A-like enzyme
VSARLALTGLLLLAACGGDGPPDRPGNRPPDLLLVSLDTLRADRLSCYGNERETRAHAPSTNTTPSHMSLFTGLDPISHGVHPARPSNKPTAALSENALTLPQLLRKAGWQTAAFTDRGGMPPSVGFGRGFEHLRSEWESITDKTDALGEHLATLERGRPLFVFFHTYETHAPYLPPRDVHGRFTDEAYEGRFRKRYERIADLGVRDAWEQKAQFLGRFDEMADADVEFLSALYDEGVAHADSRMEELWEVWGSLRDPDNTLFVVLSDHGEEFLEHDRLGHKYSLHAELVRVPLIFRGPGLGRGVVEEAVSLTGVLSTILEYLDVAPPRRLQEPSFLEALLDPAAERQERPVFSQTDNKANLRHEAVALGNRRLLRITRRDQEEFLLYDWGEDPFEQTDLAPVRAEEVADLVRLLDRRRVECERLREKIGPNLEKVLSEEEIRELQALGYTDDGEDPDESGD